MKLLRILPCVKKRCKYRVSTNKIIKTDALFFTIRPARGQAFFDAMLPEEATAMAAHFEYLEKLCNARKLLLAGPCMDSCFGIGVLQTESDEEAEAILSRDPAIKAGVMLPELHSFKNVRFFIQ